MVPSYKEFKQSLITQKGSSLIIAPETWSMADSSTRSCRFTREPWTMSPWYLRYFVALTALDSTAILHIPVRKKPQDSVWFNQPVLPALLKHSLATSLLSEFRSHVIFPQLEIRNIEDMIKCLTFPIRAPWHEFASFSLESSSFYENTVSLCVSYLMTWGQHLVPACEVRLPVHVTDIWKRNTHPSTQAHILFTFLFSIDFVF